MAIIGSFAKKQNAHLYAFPIGQKHFIEVFAKNIVVSGLRRQYSPKIRALERIMKNIPRAGFVDRQAAAPSLPDEARWIAEWCDTGSTAALDRLLRANAAHIRAMARVWSRDACRQDDLVSEGTIALICCLSGYGPREGVPPFAYARPFVHAAMRRCFYRDAAIVAVPLHHIRALREGHGSDLDRAWLQAATRPERIDDPDAAQLGNDLESAEAVLIRHETDGAQSRALDDALSFLSETERLFIERRRAGDDGCPVDLAHRAGLNQSQARKIEARALARLRTRLLMRGITSAHFGSPQ